MYVTLSGTGDKKYIRLMESHRDEAGNVVKRRIQTIGRYNDYIRDDPDAYLKLKAQYEGMRVVMTEEKSRKLHESLQYILQENRRESCKRPYPTLIYGHYALRRVWEDDLHLDRKIKDLQKRTCRNKYDLNSAISFLTFLKIIDPSSVRYSYRDRNKFVGDPIKNIPLDTLYSCYDFLKENKDSIFKHINRCMDRKFGKSRATLVFYDVTNAYFEAQLTDAEREYEQVDYVDLLRKTADRLHACGRLGDDCFDEAGPVLDRLPAWFWDEIESSHIQYLRMRGPSKEHRYDLPLVSVALVIDQNGIPMDFSVFAGNHSEFKTMQVAVENIKKKYSVKDAIVVADRGLNSSENLKMLRDAGLGFVIAQKITQLGNDHTKKLLELDEYIDINQDFPEQGKYRIIDSFIKKGKTRAQDIECKLVFTFNEKRKARDLAILDMWVDIVKSRKEQGGKVGPRRTAWASLARLSSDAGQPILGVDEKVLEEKRRLCGFAGIVYSAPPDGGGVPAPDDLGGRIAGIYHQLNRIENCFRVMKSNLGLRPMFVRNSNHIRGHVTVCVLALVLIRLIQHRLAMQQTPLTVEEICRAMGEATVTALNMGGPEITYIHSSKDSRLLESERDSDLSDADPPCSMELISRACGLPPMSGICDRIELGHCLKTRFKEDSDVIPETVYQHRFGCPRGNR